MKNVRRLRAMGSLCRQQAAYNPAQSWKLLAEAEYWEHLAQAETSSHFVECNTTSRTSGGGRIRRGPCARNSGSSSCRALSLASIATALNDRCVRSSRGGKWHTSSVANVLSRASLQGGS